MSTDQSPQSDRGRILWWVALALALAFGCAHAGMVERYRERVTRETFQSERADPAAREITLGVANDGRTWLRLTEERIARGDWRFGHTRSDGGSEGRGVYWSSIWSWWLEGLGRLRAGFAGEQLPRAIEAAATWAQLPLWLAMICGGGWWAARRWGYGAGAIFVVTLAGHRGLYVACYPAYPDHHGAIAAAALTTVLGVMATGFGRDSDDRSTSKWIWVSALAGAVGLALSAASLGPVLAGLCVAIFLCRNQARRAFGEERVVRGAGNWRGWGRVGGAAALALYVLEVVPDRVGWRLEVNHPLHALAWWGAGEFLAWWWSRGGAVRREGAREWLLPAGTLLAACAPLLVVVIGREAVFTPLDGFVAGVHRHITEFYPLWRMSGSSPSLLILSLAPFAMAPWTWRRLPEGERVSFLALLVLAGGLVVLAIWQHRWWALAASAQVPFTALTASAFLSRLREWRNAIVVGGLVAIALPGPAMLIAEQVRVARVKDVQAADAMQLLYRDLGQVLATGSGGRASVLLASPDASVGVGYYGDLKTVGTLYWENGDGLRIAARVLTATDDDMAARELTRVGVTHLLVVEPGDFTAQYLAALADAGERVPEVRLTLGRRLAEGRDVPAWARALPYAVPPQFGRLHVRVALYAFEPGLGLAESRHALGVARLVAGDEAAGRAALREAANLGSSGAALILAWRLATTERLSSAEAEDAVKLASAAVVALPESAVHRRVLAACYAAARRWPEAQAAILRAIDLAQEAGDTRAVAELEREFALYRDFRSLAE